MNLQLELSTICNFSCIYCPRPFLNRVKDYMSIGMVEKALDMFGSETTTLILSKDGEPLLHPKFKAITNIISQKYAGKIDLYTNGVFLDEDKIELLGAMPNDIHIFVTEHILGRESFQDISETVKNFKNSVEKNYKNIKFYLTKHSFYGETIEDLSWDVSNRLYKKEHSNIVATHINKHKNSWVGFIGSARIPSCPFMEYDYIGIGLTGNVLMCCSDLNEELVAGNIITDEKADIVSNWQRIRTDIKNKNIASVSPCNRCLELK